MINIIAAIDEERGIGKAGLMPWHHPGDLARFKLLTKGGIVIMGRLTWKSLGKYNRPLKDRDNFIVSSDSMKVFCESGMYQPGQWKVVCFSSPYTALIEAINRAKETKQEIWIIGGESIYKALLPNCEYLYLTEIKGKHECDRFFPEFKDKYELCIDEGSPEESYKFKVYRKKLNENSTSNTSS